MYCYYLEKHVIAEKVWSQMKSPLKNLSNK